MMRRLAWLWMCSMITAARAVIVAGGDGSGNDTASGAGSGWAYVGNVGGLSGVYLGSYGGSFWVLTASHVGVGLFTLNGVTYNPIADSAVTLTNSDGSTADLTLFRIDGDPGLANLTLATSTPLRASVTMIGSGIGREAEESTDIGGQYAGYYWSDPWKIRWGKNTVIGKRSISYTVGSGTVTTTTFYTRFNDLAGSAQATTGDSGGGVFTSDGALAGILIATGSLEGQPDGSSVYGDLTYAADIATYRSQILDIVSATPVPEPATLALLLSGASLLALRTRRAGPR